jgi:hypothetical protein
MKIGIGISPTIRQGGGTPAALAAPTDIVLSATSVQSNAQAGSVVAFISSDGNPAPTYTKTADPDNKFTISGNQLLLSATPGTGPHSVTIQATNSQGNVSETFSISVTQVEVPATAPSLVLAFYGQSNAGSHIGNRYAGAVTASAGTFLWDPATSQWRDSTWVSANGGSALIAIMNELRAVSGQTVGFVTHSMAGRGIGDLTTGADDWDVIAGRITASGGNLHGVCWHQGEGDTSNETTVSGYAAALSVLHQKFCDLVSKTKAQLPFILSSLHTAPVGGFGFSTEPFWDRVQQAMIYAGDTQTNLHYSHSNYDALIYDDGVDTLHYDPAYTALSGRRYGKTVTRVLGFAAGNTEFRIDENNVEITSATQTRVPVIHGAGTDFDDTTGYTGFEVSADGATWVTPTTVARQDATHLLLTHSSLSVAVRYLRYQGGWRPDLTKPVRDNVANCNFMLWPTGKETSGPLSPPIVIEGNPMPNLTYLGLMTAGAVDSTNGLQTLTLNGTTPFSGRRLYFFSPNSSYPLRSAILNSVATKFLRVAGPPRTGGPTAFIQQGMLLTTALNEDANLSLVCDYASLSSIGGGSQAPMFVFAVNDADLITNQPTDVRTRINQASGLALHEDVYLNEGGAAVICAFNNSTFNTYSTAADVTTPGFAPLVNANLNPPNNRTVLEYIPTNALEGIGSDPSFDIDVTWTGGTPSSRSHSAAFTLGGSSRKTRPFPAYHEPNSRVAATAVGTVLTSNEYNFQTNPDLERLMIVGITSHGRNIVSSRLIQSGQADIAGTLVAGGAGSNIAGFSANILSFLVPAGRSGAFKIEFTFDGTAALYEIMVWSVNTKDLASTTGVGGQSEGGAASTPSVSIAMPADGLALVVEQNTFGDTITQGGSLTGVPLWRSLGASGASMRFFFLWDQPAGTFAPSLTTTTGSLAMAAATFG